MGEHAHQERVAATVPMAPSEGTFHAEAVREVRNVLDDHFSRSTRPIFIAQSLSVFYPHDSGFAPDIMAVLDVSTHGRMKWAVSDEGRGIDLALEVLVSGSRRNLAEARLAEALAEIERLRGLTRA